MPPDAEDGVFEYLLCHPHFWYEAVQMANDEYLCYVVWEGRLRGIHPSYSLLQGTNIKAVKYGDIRLALKAWYARCPRVCRHTRPPPRPRLRATDEVWLRWRRDQDEQQSASREALEAMRMSPVRESASASAYAPAESQPRVREEDAIEMARDLGTSYRAGFPRPAARTSTDEHQADDDLEWESVSVPPRAPARTPSPIKRSTASASRPRRKSPVKASRSADSDNYETAASPPPPSVQSRARKGKRAIPAATSASAGPSVARGLAARTPSPTLPLFISDSEDEQTKPTPKRKVTRRPDLKPQPQPELGTSPTLPLFISDSEGEQVKPTPKRKATRRLDLKSQPQNELGSEDEEPKPAPKRNAKHRPIFEPPPEPQLKLERKSNREYWVVKGTAGLGNKAFRDSHDAVEELNQRVDSGLKAELVHVDDVMDLARILSEKARIV